MGLAGAAGCSAMAGPPEKVAIHRKAAAIAEAVVRVNIGVSPLKLLLMAKYMNKYYAIQ